MVCEENKHDKLREKCLKCFHLVRVVLQQQEQGASTRRLNNTFKTCTRSYSPILKTPLFITLGINSKFLTKL